MNLLRQLGLLCFLPALLSAASSTPVTKGAVTATLISDAATIAGIQHAAQDNVAHQSDLLYVFYPEGYMYQIDASADAIREIYDLLFKQEVTT